MPRPPKASLLGTVASDYVTRLSNVHMYVFADPDDHINTTPVRFRSFIKCMLTLHPPDTALFFPVH